MVSSVQLLEDGQVKADMKTRWEKQFLPGERLRGINSKSGKDLFFKRKCWIKKNNNQHISKQKVIFLQQGRSLKFSLRAMLKGVITPSEARQGSHNMTHLGL